MCGGVWLSRDRMKIVIKIIFLLITVLYGNQMCVILFILQHISIIMFYIVCC